MTQVAQSKVVNGVNVDQLFGTIEAIKGTPSIARFHFRATNSWIDGGHNRSTIKEFYGAGQEDLSRAKAFVMDADEPAVLLGRDNGANPVEYVLHALAACLTTSLVYHAAARGIQVEEVESTLEGDLDLHGFLGMDDSIRNGYERIRIGFKVKADASEEQIEELVRIAQQRSPVFDIVTNPVAVRVELRN
jgi:uncharacterized OsmC-like protein